MQAQPDSDDQADDSSKDDKGAQPASDDGGVIGKSVSSITGVLKNALK
ncbi:MAG TPA: hypothetical protein VF597_01870 [Candidatus Saccharimonadales bacterium]|jgi:hypothetical protein